MKIQSIDNKSPYLQDVIQLWGQYRKTLGLFPKDAFKERASKGEILIAIDSEAEFAGYLLFRTSYNRITIVHLCIAPSHRGKGITKKLITKLKKITKDNYEGIGLHCRNDYGLDNMWSGNAFIPKWEKPGRGKNGKPLTYWWCDYGHPNLLSITVNQKLESKLCVVIDGQIFFDLYGDDDESSDNNESKLLLANWLESELELCITDGIFIQINHLDNDEERKKYRQFAENQQFTVLPCKSDDLDDYQERLQNFLSQKNISTSEINFHHLVRAIVSDSHIFVTRDSRLLDIANEIYEYFKLSVIRPENLIVQLNEFTRNPKYQPTRLSGSSLEQVTVKKGEEETITNYFYCPDQNETKAQFQQKLRRFLTNPENFTCFKVVDAENKPLALIVYGKHNDYELEIPIIRVAENALSATLAQHLIFKSILHSAGENRQSTIINDCFLQEQVNHAIQEYQFIRVHDNFIRLNLAVAETAEKLSKRLKKIAANPEKQYRFLIQLAKSIKQESFIHNIQDSANIERFLFPAKIIDAEIPTYIIPIQARWAKDLFDEGLANQHLSLFAAKSELAFNKEAVYYRSAKTYGKLKAPFRILWYVSLDPNYVHVGAIRACSLADEVIIDKPENLFQIFQRLGVYKLEDLLSINKDKDDNIMAIRFSYTELLNKIELRTIQKILDSPKATFQSLYRVDNNTFKQLYNSSTNKL